MLKCQGCGTTGTKGDRDSQVDVVEVTVNNTMVLGRALLCRRCRLPVKAAWDRAVSTKGVAL